MKRIADNSRNIHLTFLNVERLFDLIPIYSILLCIMSDLCFHHLYFILLHPLDPQTAGYAVSTKILFNLVGSEKLLQVIDFMLFQKDFIAIKSGPPSRVVPNIMICRLTIGIRFAVVWNFKILDDCRRIIILRILNVACRSHRDVQCINEKMLKFNESKPYQKAEL